MSQFPRRPLAGGEISACLKRGSSWRKREILVQ